MLGFVKEALEHEKQKQEDLGLHCEVTIDGYTDFMRAFQVLCKQKKLI